MSKTRSANRRAALLAGSSLALASLTAAAGVMLTPTTALAANECGDPSANGAAADVLVCLPGTYATGVNYSTTTNGDLTVVLRDRVNTGSSNTAGTGPITMFGKTGEDMSLIRQDTVGVVGDPRIVNTSGTGRAIDVSTLGDGDILVNLTDGDPTAGEPVTPAGTALAPMRITASTDAIRAIAQGTGGVEVIIAETGVTSGVNHPKAVITAGSAAGGSGIVASTTSGNVLIDTRGAAITVGTGGFAGIDASTGTGDISIATGAVTAFANDVQYGIRAHSTGGGDITITRSSGAVDNQGAVAGATGLAAIEAVTTGGNVSVTTNGPTYGRLRTIYAQTSGTGAVDVNINGQINAIIPPTQPTISAIAAIEAVAGAGGARVTINSGAFQLATGWAIRASSTSTSATAAVNVQNLGGTVSGPIDFSGATAGGTTFNNAGSAQAAGNWNASRASVFSGFNDTLIMTGVGRNNMAAGTSFDFGAGNDIWSMSAVLTATTSSADFGTGADTFNMSGLMAATNSSMNFGTGADVFNMSGVLAVSGTFALSNLEAFNTSGVIYLGGTSGTLTDSVPDDVFRMSSGTFTGSGQARVAMDIFIGPDNVQEGCATLTVADCLDLRGASTAGTTSLVLNYLGAGALEGGFDLRGITLVDVGGGTSAAGDFVLDPNSSGYVVDSMFGGAIDRPGLFRYALRYDPDTQRHNLVGLPRSEVMEYAVLSGAAQSIWHMTAETVTDRQTALRAGTEGGSMWMRSSGEYTKRDAATDFSIYGDNFTFDDSYKLYAGTVIGGLDLAGGELAGMDYNVGVQLGYVGSSLELTASPSRGHFTGATGGVYASLWSPRFFLDAALNANGLTLDYDAAGIATKTNTFLNSLGGRVDAGMRLTLTDAIYAEPLASFAYARTSFEEISLFGGEIKPADAESLRGALGVRIGGDVQGSVVNASYYVAGRAWEEFDGDNRGVVVNPGTVLSLFDDVSGGFGEAEAGISVYNTANTLSGFVTSGVKFKDGYTATNLSLGVRMAW